MTRAGDHGQREYQKEEEETEDEKRIDLNSKRMKQLMGNINGGSLLVLTPSPSPSLSPESDCDRRDQKRRLPGQ